MWHGRSLPCRLRGRWHAFGEQLVDDRGVDVELDEAAPAGVGDQLVAVLVRRQPDDAGLEPKGQVLRDHRDVGALVGQVAGHGEDPVVVGLGRSVAGRPASSWWLISTRTVPPCSLTGNGRTSVP